MSESMAFIGGVAVAGLAALLLLKGTNTPLQSNFTMPQMPNQVAGNPLMPQQPTYPYSGGYTQPQLPPNTSRNPELEKKNLELEKSNEQMRLQNQQLQWQLQNIQQQQQLAQQNAAQMQQARLASLPAQTPAPAAWWSSPIIWAVGGATLTIGGGVVVAGVLSLFSPRQKATRTVQVIHPSYNGQTPSLSPVRRAEFLPSRVEARRVESPEYDEMR